MAACGADHMVRGDVYECFRRGVVLVRSRFMERKSSAPRDIPVQHVVQIVTAINSTMARIADLREEAEEATRRLHSVEGELILLRAQLSEAVAGHLDVKG